MTRPPPTPQPPRPVHAPDRPAAGEPPVPTRPISACHGDDRGTPIQRHDLEGFLRAHPIAVQGFGSLRACVGLLLGEATEEPPPPPPTVPRRRSRRSAAPSPTDPARPCR